MLCDNILSVLVVIVQLLRNNKKGVKMFQIDVMSRTPVYEQIIKQTEDFLLKGILKCGDKMPSVRSLSSELSVNPNTIQKALVELDRKGLIQSVPGKGSFITPDAVELIKADKTDELDVIKVKLKDLKLAGITKELILACVDEVFNVSEKGGGNND